MRFTPATRRDKIITAPSESSLARHAESEAELPLAPARTLSSSALTVSCTLGQARLVRVGSYEGLPGPLPRLHGCRRARGRGRIGPAACSRDLAHGLYLSVLAPCLRLLTLQGHGSSHVGPARLPVTNYPSLECRRLRAKSCGVRYGYVRAHGPPAGVPRTSDGEGLPGPRPRLRGCLRARGRCRGPRPGQAGCLLSGLGPWPLPFGTGPVPPTTHPSGPRL